MASGRSESIGRFAAALGRFLPRGRAAGGRQTLWRAAERAAARHLRRKRWRILARNLQIKPVGEIDILAIDPASGHVVVVEVKAGRSEDPPPEVHVNAAKQRKLTRLAHAAVRRYGLETHPIRFDVVAVVWPEGARKPSRVTHHVNAFGERR